MTILDINPTRARLNLDQNNACKGLFITDLDGTLLRSDGTFASKDLAALDLLSRKGVRTAIATGRSLHSFRKACGTHLPVDYVIFSSGAGLVKQPASNIMYHVNIKRQDVEYTLKYMHGTSYDFMLHHPIPDNHRFVYRRFSEGNKDFETRIRRNSQFAKSIKKLNGKAFGEAAQFLVVIPPDNTQEALRVLKQGLPGLSIIRATSPLDHQSTWVEIFHPDVSKSRTAAWLALELGVSPMQTMAVGNDYNDEDLLDWAAHSYVVENSPEDLTCRFQQVASNNDGGVAEAIYCWLDKSIG